MNDKDPAASTSPEKPEPLNLMLYSKMQVSDILSLRAGESPDMIVKLYPI